MKKEAKRLKIQIHILMYNVRYFLNCTFEIFSFTFSKVAKRMCLWMVLLYMRQKWAILK